MNELTPITMLDELWKGGQCNPHRSSSFVIVVVSTTMMASHRVHLSEWAPSMPRTSTESRLFMTVCRTNKRRQMSWQEGKRFSSVSWHSRDQVHPTLLRWLIQKQKCFYQYWGIGPFPSGWSYVACRRYSVSVLSSIHASKFPMP